MHSSPANSIMPGFEPRVDYRISPKLAVDLVLLLLSVRVVLGAVGVWVNVGLSAPLTFLNFATFSLLALSSPVFCSRYLKLTVYLLCFAFVSVLSFIITAPPEIARGLDAVFRVVYLAAWVGFASIYFRGQYAVERLRQFVRFLIGFGFAISVLQIIAAPDRFQIAGEVRAFGVSSHPVLFGMLMLLAIVADEILRLKLDRSKSVTDYVIRLMGLLAMTFAVAQTAWLMLAIIIVVLASYNVPRRLRGVSFLLLAGVSMGMIYALPWTRDLFSLFEIFTSFGEISSDVYSYHLVDNSMAWRVVNWKMSLSAAMPVWYSGFGPGHSEFYNYFGLTLHNMFFEVFVETGVFGLLFLFAIVLEITRCLRQSGHVGALGEVRARRLFVAFSLSLFAACVLSVTLLGQTLLLTLYFSLLVIVTTPTSEMG